MCFDKDLSGEKLNVWIFVKNGVYKVLWSIFMRSI